MTVLSSTRPVSRKEHYCENCRTTIPKGVKYHRVNYIAEGEMMTDTNHEDCFAAVKANWSALEMDEGYFILFDYLVDDWVDEGQTVWDSLIDEFPDVLARLSQHEEIRAKHLDVVARATS